MKVKSSYVRHTLRPGTLFWYDYHYQPKVAIVIGPSIGNPGFLKLLVQETGQVKVMNYNWIPKESIICESR